MKTYNKKNKVLDDIFVKKYCKEMWSKMQIVEYLLSKYGYTPSVSKRYYERLRQLVTEHVQVDYDNVLAQRIEYMIYQIQDAPESFTRLQWVKELNNIQGLKVQKYQVESTIKNINVIELNYALPKQWNDVIALTEAEIVPVIVPIELKQDEKQESNTQTNIPPHNNV